MAKAASPRRLSLASKLVSGIKVITPSKIQVRKAHLDNLVALASASRAVRSACQRPVPWCGGCPSVRWFEADHQR